MAIKGSLEEASLPDVLQLLSMGRKTGRLSVTDWTNLGYIYVDSGRITFATLVNRRDRIGDILLKSGKITEAELGAALKLQERDHSKKLGEALLEAGAIDRSVLEHHMRVQIEEAAYFLFTWRRGNFTFESGVQPEEKEFLVSIEPESLLLEGARRTDEWTLVEKKIPSFDLVFKVDEERLASSEANLSDHQKQLVSLLDGTRNVSTLVDESGLVEFEVGKALYELVNAGLAHATGRRQTESSLPVEVTTSVSRPDKDGEVEHFDFVQLATYLARQGEFSDPDRRKEAALHITDCAVCSQRLREIHKRRSGSLATLSEELTVSEPGEGHLSEVDLFTYVAREGEFSSAERRKKAAQHIADCAACTKRLKKIHRRRTGTVSGASPAMSAHLDDLQLITYAAREGEFIDPQRRREVAFHVADCSSCSKRLKEIHRKRTERVPAVAAVEVPAPAETAEEEESEEAVPEPVPERRSGLDRRVSDGSRREVGGDRRISERRSGRERRVAERRRRAEGPGRKRAERRTGGDRRRADRRVSDRRVSDRRGAISGWSAFEDRAAAAVAVAGSEATIGAIRASGGVAAPMPRRREVPPVRRTPVRETRSRMPLDGDAVTGTEQDSAAKDMPVREAERPAASDRKPRSGAPTRSDRVAASTEPPIVMKAQTDSLVVPKTEFKLLESERKSLAGLPLLDVDSASRNKGESDAEPATTQAVPEAREVAVPPPRAKASRSEVATKVEHAEEAEAASVEDAPAVREETGPVSTREKVPQVEKETGIDRESETPRVGVDAPAGGRGTPVSLRGPDDDWDRSAKPRSRGTPKSLREISPDLMPERRGEAVKAGPAEVRESAKSGGAVRSQSLGRWAALIAVAIAAWFARPVGQALFGGGGGSSGDTPDLAATRLVPTDAEGRQEPAAAVGDTADLAVTGDSSAAPVEQATPVVVRRQRTEPATPPEAAVSREVPPVEERPARQREEAPAAPEPEEVEAPVLAEPTMPTMSGTVRAVGSGAPLAGARVSIRGTDMTATSDATGSFSIPGLPAGSLSVVAELAGYIPAGQDIVSVPGNDVRLNLILHTPPAALEPDDELSGGQWQVIGPSEAESILARPAPVISGLWLESLAKPTAGTRPRVRVAQLTTGGERVTLTVTRAGPPVREPVARVTAMRVIPPTEAYPVTTGTASFGNLLVTAKGAVSADSLRAMLGRLVDSSGGAAPR